MSCAIKYSKNTLTEDPDFQAASLKHAPEMEDVIAEVNKALEKGKVPEICDVGVSTMHDLRDENGKIIAVFKVNNALKEYCAYRLDHQHFANIPPTVITTLSHSAFGGKVTGACQLYIENSTPADKLEKGCTASFDPSNVRRMAQLDIRIVNQNRSLSNILVDQKHQLVPIEHECSLANIHLAQSFVWADWDQAATPFTSEEKEYIEWLDAENDRKILIEELNFPEEVGNRLYTATVLLKIGVAYDLNAAQLGAILLNPQLMPKPLQERLLETVGERCVGNWA